MTSTYAWGEVHNMIAPDDQTSPATIHEDLSYTPEFVSDYWEKTFGDIERVEEFVVDDTGPTKNYKLGADGHVRFKTQIAYGSTVSHGKKSKVYLYRGAFESPAQLYLTAGHEYIHVGFNWHCINVSPNTEEATAYSWNYRVVTNMKDIPKHVVELYRTRYNETKPHYDHRYNYLMPKR